MSRTDNHQDIAQDVLLERLTTYCTLVAVAILFFDHFLTLSSEIRFIWPARWSFGKVLYFLTKYLVFFDVAITLFIYFAPKRISPATCNTLYRIESISYTVGIAIAELTLAFRTWTIWWNNRWIVWILRLALFVHIVPVFVMAGLGVYAAEYGPSPIPALIVCWQIKETSRLVFPCYILLCALETEIIALTLYKGFIQPEPSV
ncbi:hypothetical protein M422DRAFT_37253 [Sphaerobolus stellatus SS14]|uniref:DUF6533 domain-containing protein n=1 Tax=Sphaerobolus stellatus (strain SS14) TaxID=990650 RepID=A0A0C9UTK7_SPHS4|nr:hypothetical protein M422DRAFT_37253 [Sphaerobolus stellatus SS14]